MADRYMDNMTRQASESQRLEGQFDIMTENIGYLIHPSVVAALPENPRIADIATGTGVFLLRVRELYPNAVLDGSDISSALFPPPSELPPNVTLTEFDVKQPVPEELHGKYDLVHVRMIIAGMQPEDWAPAVKNLTKLLKPGGFLQWEEGDFISARHVRGSAEYVDVGTMRTLAQGFRDALRERFSNGWNMLPAHMEAAGLQPVFTDMVCSDRVPATRERATVNSMHAILTWARMMAQRGVPGARTLEEIDGLEKKVGEEIKAGGYVRYDLHIACGRKPVA